MAYVKPDEVVENMVQAGTNKANLSVKDLLIRGFLSGALLGFATTLAFTTAGQTGAKIAGAVIFPVGFVMIVLLGLELVTGNFALVPVSLLDGKTNMSKLMQNWSWVFFGNLVGCLFYALLFTMTVAPDAPIVKGIIETAEAKTLAYQKMGMQGMQIAIIKAILCNWMVTMGVVMAMTSKTTGGKILAMWLPITTFFGQGFEHSVVNMFVIPAGMMLGANVSMAEWWVWNQIPVTLGNVIGGMVFTGMALYYTYRKPALAAPAVQPVAFAPDNEAVPVGSPS